MTDGRVTEDRMAEDREATERGRSSAAGQGGEGREGPLRRLYHWVLGWADRPGGPVALFGIAVAEASFFPIPPDVLLIPLAIGKPKRAWWFAALCTAGSVLGAAGGYAIGAGLYEAVGEPILQFYGYSAEYARLGELYDRNLIVTLGTAGFTPIPFKVFTIAAGGFGVSVPTFLAVSAASRGARFFIVAALIRVFGPQIRDFIERHFNWLSLALAAAVVGGFLLLGLL